MCCCVGGPCHHPAGKGVAKMKADWNASNNAQPFWGISDHPLEAPKSSKIADR
jgi:hypothetical protein